MSIDPAGISLMALIISAAMSVFGVFTYRQKAGRDETNELKVDNAEMKKQIAELKASLLISEAERNRLTRENYSLMTELLAKKNELANAAKPQS